jgi:hypothetical protein
LGDYPRRYNQFVAEGTKELAFLEHYINPKIGTSLTSTER